MRKIIRCSSITNKTRDWLSSEEVDKLVKGCTSREKRLFGKIANSKNIAEYLGAVVDAIDVLDIDISDSFDKFLGKALEMNTSVNSSKSTDNRRRIRGSYECQYIVIPWREEDDLDLGPFLTYREAQEAGEEFYPDGYDIEDYCPEEY